MYEAGSVTCTIAETEFDVEENFGDFDVMHFEIEKMPCKFIRSKSLRKYVK